MRGKEGCKWAPKWYNFKDNFNGPILFRLGFSTEFMAGLEPLNSGKSLHWVKFSVKGITKMGPAFGCCLGRAYFGNAFDLRFHPTHKPLEENSSIYFEGTLYP
jgi:hypothetical protein